MRKGKEQKRARFLVLQAKVGDRPALAVFHVIFYREGDFWFGECLECDNIIAYDRNWERVQWKLADAIFTEIGFAHKHGFLESAFSKITPSKMARWRKIRKEEGLTTSPPDLTKLTYKPLHETEKPTPPVKMPPNFIIPQSEHSYTYIN